MSGRTSIAGDPLTRPDAIGPISLMASSGQSFLIDAVK